MKILFVISRVEKPSSQFRVLAYLPYLQKNGIQYEVMEASRGFFNRLLLPLRARSYDICFIQKKLLNPIELKVLRASVSRIIFDFDDAIWLQNVSDANKKLSFLKNADKTGSIIKLSDMIFAGNEYLKEYAAQFNNNIRIVPTTIEMVDIPGLTKGGSRNDGNKFLADIREIISRAAFPAAQIDSASGFYD